MPDPSPSTLTVPKWMTFVETYRSFKVTLCQPLPHIRHWVSWKPLEMEAWFQMTINRKWPMMNRMVTWQLRHATLLKGQTCDPNTLRAQYFENGWRYRDSVGTEHHGKWSMGNQMVTWLMTSRDRKGQVVTPIRLESISWKQLELLFNNNR